LLTATTKNLTFALNFVFAALKVSEFEESSRYVT